MKPQTDFTSFAALDIRVGTILKASQFERARVPAYRLSIDFGAEIGMLQTSAQLTKRYDINTLVDRKIIAIVNFPAKNIAGFMSQCLVLGVVGEAGDVSLLSADEPVSNGQKIG